MLSYEELIKKISQNEANLQQILKETAAVKEKRDEYAAKCSKEFGTDVLSDLILVKDKLLREIKQLEGELQ